MFGRRVGETLKVKGHEYVFGEIISIIPKASGIIANLEAPFAKAGNAFFNKDRHLTFKIAPDIVSALQYMQISSVTLANNHITDYGFFALDSTINSLKGAEISFSGAGSDIDEAIVPIEYVDKATQESIRIFSFNAFVPFTTAATKNKYGVARFEKKTVYYALNKFRSKHNIFIITVHWGIDYHQFPVPQLIKFAKQLIDDFPEIIAIIGHHPHLQQPVIYHNKRPIFCSLGNFLFDEPFPLSRIGSILTLDIQDRKVINHSFIYTKLDEKFKLIPLPEIEYTQESQRLIMIKQKIDEVAKEYKKMDKKWIKYLICQTIKFRSYNDMNFLFSHYGPIQIIKELALR